MQKKKKHSPWKKSTKSTPAHQKKWATEKSTKKHYGAFKSTHYDPWSQELTHLSDPISITFVTNGCQSCPNLKISWKFSYFQL